MTTIKDVLTALKTRLSLIDKLGVGFDSGNINPPYALLSVPSIPDYRRSFNGNKMSIDQTVTVLTSSALDEVGTLRLAEFMAPVGPKSINALINDDPTLGGVVEACRLADFRPIGMDEYGMIGYYGGVFTLAIMASG